MPSESRMGAVILESRMEWGYSAGSDAGRLLYFSDAFLMHYQIGGDVPCSKEDIQMPGMWVRDRNI